MSLDSFFVGLSLGLQKEVKFVHILAMNALLSTLCFVGFFLAESITLPPFVRPDFIVGGAFISFGLWGIIQTFRNSKKAKANTKSEAPPSPKTLIPVGIVMSVEAMLITMGITLIFADNASIAIPITVAAAHLVYAIVAFHLARIKTVSKIPRLYSSLASGLALVVYGVLAIVG